MEPPNAIEVTPESLESNVNDFIQEVRQENVSRNLKRKIESESDQVDVKLEKKELSFLIDRLQSVFSVEKSPIQILNELYPNSKNVEIIEKGSFGQPHEPLHITCVVVKNIGTFIGRAKSKQDSKQYAAKMALEYLQSLRSNIEPQLISPVGKTKKKKLKRDNKDIQLVSQTSPTAFSIDNKSDNFTVPYAASESHEILVENISSSQDGQPLNLNNDAFLETEKFMLDSEFSRKIWEVVNQKWSEIFNPINIQNLISKNVEDEKAKIYFNSQDLWRYKEMAGFVVFSQKDQTFRVLSLANGTKTINSSNLSLNGDVVQDLHAEILAKRSLMLVLYEHLQALLDNNYEDNPEFVLEFCEKSGKFRLKSFLELHLFISSPPCGDSRVFNFVENSKTKFVSKGILRVKIEKGQGSVPMPHNYIATWDGILASSQRCTFMSCSDKVSLWNVVGVQGSMLSYFLEPIYFKSLVVSNLFHYNHLVRALHGRIDKNYLESKVENLAFRLNECLVGFYNLSNEKDQSYFIPSYSHNWYDSLECYSHAKLSKIEILRCDSGKNYINDEISQLCKRNLLKKFIKLMKTQSDVSEELINFLIQNNLSEITYAQLKSGSLLYNRAKKSLFETFSNSGLGTWVSSPIDIDFFPINIDININLN